MAPIVTAGALTRSVGPESGVAAVVVDNELVDVREYRSSGIALEVLGTLHAMLYASRAHRNVSVDVIAPEAVVDIVEEYLTTGRVLAQEAAHVLIGVANVNRGAQSVGNSFRFIPGEFKLDVAAGERFEQSVAEAEDSYRIQQQTTWALPAEDAQWAAEVGATVVYTDGASVNRSGYGAWAWFVDGELHDSGTKGVATSVFFERMAMIKALRAIAGPVVIVHDLDAPVAPDGSTLLASHARQLRTLRRLTRDRQVRFVHVKAHSNCPGNAAADQLARAACQRGWAHICENPRLRQHLEDAYEVKRDELAAIRQKAGTLRQIRKIRERLAEGKYATSKERRGMERYLKRLTRAVKDRADAC